MFRRMTASQKRGALLLLVVLVCIAGWRWRLAYLAENAPLPSGEEVAGANAEMPEQREKSEKSQQDWKGDKRTEAGDKPSVMVELNAADTAELKQVSGIGPVLSKRIVKYRKLVGGFTQVSQLKQVYGLSEENYERIVGQVYVDTNSSAYLELSKRQPPNVPPVEDSRERDLEEKMDVREPFEEKQEETNTILNLNLADSAALVRVKGIGPSTARNIIKYRKLIYFFHSLDQLSEVWGVRPENLERMKPYLEVGADFEGLPHIEVNTADVEGLAKHKYLGYKEARVIVAYRDQHGPYSSLSDLQNIHSIDDALWKRLEPYLRF